MKILVMGASQGTGAEVVKAALAKGHEVTAFARSPQKLELDPALDASKLTRLKGDLRLAQSVNDAVAGHDAVVMTAAPSGFSGLKEDPTFISRSTGMIITAMQLHGVKRLVVLSSLGTGDSKNVFGFILRKVMVEGLLKAVYVDHDREDALVRASGLEWVLARPSRLTNGPAKRRYVKVAALEKVPSSISRADVADFLVEAASSPEWVRKAVHLGG